MSVVTYSINYKLIYTDMVNLLFNRKTKTMLHYTLYITEYSL